MSYDNTLPIFERLFKSALRIRLVEERIVEIYPSDLIQSPVHLSIGQEPVAVGVCAPLKKTDLLFSTYRTHALYLAKGGDLNEMFAELYGRLTGVAAGKAGSMHLTAPAVGMMGSSAIVGSSLPHAAGAALASKQRGTEQVIVCVFGDGATEEGVYHETLNFMALHKLPVLLVCENNALAVHSTIEERQSYNIIKHVQAYGISTTVINNGNDLLTVSETVVGLVDQIRINGAGPQFIEIHTCRYKEHVGTGDDFEAGYRTEESVDKWKETDPLLNNPELVERFTPEITEEIDQACKFAGDSPFPRRDELLQHIL